MRFLRSLAAPCLVALFAPAAVPVAGQRPDPLVLGIFRSDGIVVPVFHHDGTAWRSVGDPSEATRLWRSIRSWTVHTFDGEVQEAEPTNALRIVDDYDPWGQATNLPGRPFPAVYRPIPRLGLAITRPLPTAVFNGGAVADDLPVGLVGAVKTLFALHAAQLDVPGDSVQALVDAVEVARFWRAEVPAGRPIGYFEAIREANATCEGPYYHLTGWAVQVGDDWRLTANSWTTADCDGKGSRGALPFAVVSIDSEVLLLSEAHEWESLDWELWRLTGDEFEKVLVWSR